MNFHGIQCWSWQHPFSSHFYPICTHTQNDKSTILHSKKLHIVCLLCVCYIMFFFFFPTNFFWKFSKILVFSRVKLIFLEENFWPKTFWKNNWYEKIEKKMLVCYMKKKLVWSSKWITKLTISVKKLYLFCSLVSLGHGVVPNILSLWVHYNSFETMKNGLVLRRPKNLSCSLSHCPQYCPWHHSERDERKEISKASNEVSQYKFNKPRIPSMPWAGMSWIWPT